MRRRSVTDIPLSLKLLLGALALAALALFPAQAGQAKPADARSADAKSRADRPQIDQQRATELKLQRTDLERQQLDLAEREAELALRRLEIEEAWAELHGPAELEQLERRAEEAERSGNEGQAEAVRRKAEILHSQQQLSARERELSRYALAEIAPLERRMHRIEIEIAELTATGRKQETEALAVERKQLLDRLEELHIAMERRKVQLKRDALDAETMVLEEEAAHLREQGREGEAEKIELLKRRLEAIELKRGQMSDEELARLDAELLALEKAGKLPDDFARKQEIAATLRQLEAELAAAKAAGESGGR